MSSVFDGLSNINSLTNSINALKKAQQAGTTVAQPTDPKNYALQLEQNFNQMLTSLTSTPDDNSDEDSSDPFSFMNTNSTNSLLSQYGVSSTASQSNLSTQQLAVLEGSASLLGREVTYNNPTAAGVKTGIVAKVTFDQNSNPVLVLTDGTSLSPQAVLAVIKP